MSKEYAQLSPIVTKFKSYKKIKKDIKQIKEMLVTENDFEIKDLAKEELIAAEYKIQKLITDLKILLLPIDPNDRANVFLEIRAGKN